MTDEALRRMLRERYGLQHAVIQPLRNVGGAVYTVTDGRQKLLLKRFGQAFADTAATSIRVSSYLSEQGFPAPALLRTVDGQLSVPAEDGFSPQFVLQAFIEGAEPDVLENAVALGEMTGRLHRLMENCPVTLPVRGEAFFVGRYLSQLAQKGYPAEKRQRYADLGERLWRRVARQTRAACHGDLYSGNWLLTHDKRLFLLDLDTFCVAPRMLDLSVLCDTTDYFRYTPDAYSRALAAFQRCAEGYARQSPLTEEERASFPAWVALRHFHLQATILCIYGLDCVDDAFLDRQMDWLTRWTAQTGCA